MGGEMHAFLAQPGVGFFSMIIIGALAGWIAERITESDHGLITNILMGIGGAFIGGKIAELLDIPVFGFFRTLIAAVIGAVIIIFVWRKIRSSQAG